MTEQTEPQDANTQAPPPTPEAIPAGAPSTATPPRAEDGRLRGISKSILIGVGGTGHRILLDVRKRLMEKYGSWDRIPIVSFIQLDTDTAVLSKDVNYDDRANLDRADKLHCTVHGVDGLRERIHDYPHLRGWLDERALTGDIYQGAGAIRARGRLAYFWNYTTIARKIEAEYQEITRADSIASAINNGLTVGDAVTVYIVGSLLGGTGSGMFLDLAYTVRDKLGRNPLVELVGIFTIPPNSEAVAVDNRPNAYASLLELNHYSHPGTVFDSQYGASIPPIRDSRPPFTYTYLVDMSNPRIALNSVDELTRMIGHSIFLDLTSEFQRQKKSNRDNFNQYLIQPDRLGCPQNYLSMGLAAITFPADKVMAACSHRLARDILTGWMTPGDPGANITAYVDQEMGRLGLLPDEVQRQITLVNAETGETLRDTIAGYWRQVNRQYESAFPGYEKVAGLLQSREQAFAEKWTDSDANPDLLQKRRENMGEYVRLMQENLRTLLTAKERALGEFVGRVVNNPEHRHPVALTALVGIQARLRAEVIALGRAHEERSAESQSLVEQREKALADINRYAHETIMRLIPRATRSAIDEKKDLFIEHARHGTVNVLEAHAAAGALRFYEVMLERLLPVQAELDRFATLMVQARAFFWAEEARAVTTPVDVNGEVMFEPGRRVVDEAGNETYVGGDIDERYAAYAGDATARGAVADRVLAALGVTEGVFALKDQPLGRVEEVLAAESERVFAPIRGESVLQKFFARHSLGGGRASEILKRVNDLCAPFIHLPVNAAGYEHHANKEQTVIGVLNGGRPQTEEEVQFRRLMNDTLPSVHGQNLANSGEPHQVLLLRERAGFPLRLLGGLANYRYAYDLARGQGASANPMHTRKDIREWMRIDPPSVEDQKAAWETFVVAWAAGVIQEQTASRRTAVGEEERVSFSVTYSDNFGLPKTDLLGSLTPRPREAMSAGFSDATLPPSELREIVLRLCDDRTLHSLVRKAIDRRLEELGRQGLGDRLVQHARQQHEIRLPFYDNYHLALVGDPNRVPPVEGFLVKIGYQADEPVPSAPRAAATSAPSAVPLAPTAPGALVCSVCGSSYPEGTRFCPQHGATLAPAGESTMLICRTCGQRFPVGSRFCPQHGPTLEPEAPTAVVAAAPVGSSSPSGTVEERLARLKQLNEAGLITDAEYNDRKSTILREV